MTEINRSGGGQPLVLPFDSGIILPVNADSVPATAAGSMNTNEQHGTFERVRLDGKFLALNGRRFLVKGVTYGSFAPDETGEEYHDLEMIRRDFAAMAAVGINTVRIPHTVPPIVLLDIAAEHGLRVMVGLGGEHYVGYLIDRNKRANVPQWVRERVRPIAGHPALLCYGLGNEIPGGMARWIGRRNIERYLYTIYDAVKSEDPDALISYVNYPTTEYLRLPFLDIVSFNVYLESQERFSAYLKRLHNVAGERPLLMSETGLDSLRNGETGQAISLQWQIETAFESGCAGAIVFSWTDDWHRSGRLITDWAFGLTRVDRSAKPALGAVSNAFSRAPFSFTSRRWPKFSVVVCSYNGAGRIAETIHGLKQLRYPDFEVIIVDDGSSDATLDIAVESGFRVIWTPNEGLSSARNMGIQSATGEIVAFLDDDAWPDPDWLYYLALTFESGRFVGVGGPNLPPASDGAVAQCVANAPGGPTHVLITDDEAEHVPGCNMAFRRSALESIGGFDRQFRCAGDDVDLCWRIHDAGWRIGFSPAAVVWHRRRSTIAGYLRQQAGYGRAEALLAQKWPQRYNRMGHTHFSGRIYDWGAASMPFRRVTRVYHGMWGMAPFQRLYDQPCSSMGALFLMPEWLLMTVLLGALSLCGLLWAPLLAAVPLFVAAVVMAFTRAVRAGIKARFPKRWENQLVVLRMRALTGLLHVLQPIARLRGRIAQGLALWRSHAPGRFVVPKDIVRSVWIEHGIPQDQWIERVEKRLRSAKIPVRRGGEFDVWDLEARGGALAATRVTLVAEEHGGGRQYLRIRLAPWFSVPGFVLPVLLALLAIGAIISQSWFVAITLTALSLAPAARQLRQWGGCATAVLDSLDAVCSDRDCDAPADGESSGAATTSQGRKGGFFNKMKRFSASGSLSSHGLRRYGDRTLFTRLWEEARPFRWHLLSILALSLAAAPIALVTPLPLKIAVDSVFGSEALPAFIRAIVPAGLSKAGLLLACAVMLVGIGIIKRIQELGSWMLNTYTGERLKLSFRGRLLHHAQRLSLSWHDKRGTNDALYRIQYDTPAIEAVLVKGLASIITAVITLLGMIYVTMQIDLTLGLVAILVVPLLLLSIEVHRRRVRNQWSELKEAQSGAFSIAEETLSSLRIVRAFGQEDLHQSRFTARATDGFRRQMRLALFEGGFGLWVGATISSGMAAALLIGGYRVLSGAVSIGNLLIVMSYLAQLYAVLQAISKQIAQLQSGLAGADRAFSLLDEAPDVPEAVSPVRLQRSRGTISFNDVSFRYEHNVPVLRSISFEAASGSRVGIVGTTGAGKSTLVSLLPRFFDPTSGSIRLDGRDLREYHLRDLRRQFAIVLQEPVLFAATIRENIAYARPGATDREIEAAVEAAHAGEFIRALPDGYQTMVGTRGQRLSVGERQRIALARAFLRDAPILILDEPTSAVDIGTERFITSALRNFMRGRTTFIVAHRLSTLESCDFVLHLEHGALVRKVPPTDLFVEQATHV